MAFIRTINGDIAPSELGVTYSHDHLFCVPPLWKEKKLDDFMIDDLESSIKDVDLFTAQGGQAVYDATAIDYGRDPTALKAISDRTGIKIIATAGICSRRKAEELIIMGQVLVNGEVVNTLGAKADPHNDIISVEGKVIEPFAAR